MRSILPVSHVTTLSLSILALCLGLTGCATAPEPGADTLAQAERLADGTDPAVPRDQAAAVPIFAQAAAEGNAEAALRLGYAHDFGQGVAVDREAAFIWYSRAAELGSIKGQLALANAYKFGRGTETDLAAAARWYRRAAEAGSDEGQYSYGLALLYGQGVEVDREDAARWLRLAAQQDYAKAERLLRREGLEVGS